MRNNISMYAALLFLMVSGTSCQESPEEMLKLQPDGTALVKAFDQNLDDMRQSIMIDAETGGKVKGSSGALIDFKPNSFKTHAGVLATGNVSIELIEIYKKKDMLMSRKPTMGRKPHGALATLVSGGQFFVNATQNGEQLILVGGYNLIVPVDNTNGADNEMQLFEGIEMCEGNDCKVIWEPMERGVEVGRWQDVGGVYSAYYAFQNKFGWTNIDKWYNDLRDKTTIYIDLPDEYNNTNCAIYLSYDGEASALAQFDKFDKDKGLFTEHYGLIPIGLKVHFIVVSIVEDQWHYAIAQATITENHVQVISELISTSETDLVKMVDALP